MDFIFSRSEGARVCDKMFYKDLRLVVLENDVLRIVVVPEKGADIVAFVDKRTGIDVMLRLPMGLRSPKSEASLLNQPNARACFHEGGWQELFPVASEFGNYYGHDQPFHGEASQLMWDYAVLEDSAERVSVEFRVRTVLSPFELRRRMILDSSSTEVRLEESIENLSELDLTYMWGHHPAFGAPFLSGDCRIELPRCRLLEGNETLLKIPAQSEVRKAMFYATDLASGIYGLHNDRLEFGFGMKWDHQVFPKIWIWQSSHEVEQSPYFKREYGCAIEPFTNLPHQWYAETDPLTVLKAREIKRTALTAFLYRGDLPA